MTSPDTGIIYIAFGELYRKLAVLSISYLRRFGYFGPVRVLTDLHGWNLSQLGCEVIEVSDSGHPFGSRRYKTRLTEYGYNTTLFLDADTLPLCSIGRLWREIRNREICMCADYHPTVQDLVVKSSRKGAQRRDWTGRMSTAEPRQPEYGYMAELGLMYQKCYSSGVILFRRCRRTDCFFEAWHEEWNRFGREDQLALIRAIHRTGLSVGSLSLRWNARLKPYGTIENARLRGAGILHFRPVDAPVFQMLFDKSAISHEESTEWLNCRLERWRRRVATTLETRLGWMLSRS
jgi:hypothetical protein